MSDDPSENVDSSRVLAYVPGPRERTQRRRSIYLILLALVMTVGLMSRHWRAATVHSFVSEYAADTLWGMMFFVIIALLRPRWSTRLVALLALTVTWSIEISQVYHRPWIDSIRGTLIGGLLLGHTFLWSDMICLVVGVSLAAIIELVARFVVG